MDKRNRSVEIDYVSLEFTKDSKLTDDFANVIFRAFFLDSGCKSQSEIAGVLGISTGRLSQIKANPKKLTPNTIRVLLEGLSSERARRSLLSAWIRENFPDEFNPTRSASTRHTLDPKEVMSHFDQLLIEHRYQELSEECIRQWEKAPDFEFGQQCLDRAFFAKLKLNQYGQALEISQKITDDSTFENLTTARFATADFFAARAVMLDPYASKEIIDKLVSQVRNRLRVAQLRDSKSVTYYLVRPSTLERFALECNVSFWERGCPLPEYSVLVKRQDGLIRSARVAKNPLRKRQLLSLAARIASLIGDSVQAEDLALEALGSTSFDLSHEGAEMALHKIRLLYKNLNVPLVVDQLIRISNAYLAKGDHTQILPIESDIVSRILKTLL